MVVRRREESVESQSVLSTQHSVLSTQYSALSTQYPVLSSIRRLSKQDIDPIESHGAAANHRAGGNRAPENVRARKFPNSQQRR